MKFSLCGAEKAYLQQALDAQLWTGLQAGLDFLKKIKVKIHHAATPILSLYNRADHATD